MQSDKLTRLKGRNFQQHRTLAVELDPRVTTIVGNTGTGKSTILRLLRWVALNQAPRGDFILHGEDWVSGTLEFGSLTIHRHRGPRQNSYEIDGARKAVVKKTVPPQAQTIMGLGEINFQAQLDPHFWLCDTAGQVGRSLNRIVNLDLIDQVLTGVASDLRQISTEKVLTRKRLDDVSRQVSNLRWVEDADRRLVEVERLQKQAGEARKRADGLAGLLDQLDEAGSGAALASRIAQDARRALQSAQKALGLMHKVRGLSRLLGDLEACRDTRALPAPDLTPVDRKLRRITKLKTEVVGLTELLDQLRREDGDLCRAKRDAQAAERELNRLMRGRCPLCGRSD